MTQPGSHHDQLVKMLLGTPSSASTFLRERLPPGIVALMAPEPPELLPGSFIDTRQSEHHSDLLFRIALASGRSAYVQVLIEHDSRQRSSPKVLVKLLRYMTLIWERHLEDGHGLPLPPVIPLVICHGAEPWCQPPGFAGLFDVEPELEPFLPSFAYALFDLHDTADRDLSKEPFLRFAFAVLKLSRWSPDFRSRLLELLSDRVWQDDRYARLLIYMLRVYSDLDENLMNRLTAGLSTEERTRMTTLLERKFAEGEAAGLQKGEALGMQKGKAIGLREGRAAALLELLEHRFGPIPSMVRQRLDDASLDMIDAWFRRAIDASGLERVFDPE